MVTDIWRTEQGRSKLSVFALMAGTLQLSRALADPQLADEVLEQGRQNALTLLAPANSADAR